MTETKEKEINEKSLKKQTTEVWFAFPFCQYLGRKLTKEDLLHLLVEIRDADSLNLRGECVGRKSYFKDVILEMKEHQ